MKKLLTGNEAIAEGIIESGVEVVTGYPGTPSTAFMLTCVELTGVGKIITFRYLPIKKFFSNRNNIPTSIES